MPYLIDGHNLIPKLGLRLDDPDDELQLARLLQDFARIRRQPVEVYFDGAPAGQAGMRKIGTIRAHFVLLGQTADAAMRKRLETMGRSAKNWTVVSSDREVLGAAKAHQARSLRAEEFVALLRAVLQAGVKQGGAEPTLSTQEVDDWLTMFDSRE